MSRSFVYVEYGIHAVTGSTADDVVVAVLLFNVHGKTSKVRPGQSVNLTTLFLGRVRPTKRLTSTSCN